MMLILTSTLKTCILPGASKVCCNSEGSRYPCRSIALPSCHISACILAHKMMKRESGAILYGGK